MSVEKKFNVSNCINSRHFVLIVASFALFLDNLLSTVIVPIMPNVLREYDRRDNITEITRIRHVFEPNDTTRPQNASYFPSNGSIYLQSNKNNTNRLDKPHSGNSMKIGFLFASKQVVQILVTVFVGKLINRIGYTIPMLLATLVLFTSSIIYAFGDCYIVLVVARMIHAIGSSLITVGGFGLLAHTYIDEEQRGKAMTVALVGLSLGLINGPVVGGALYKFFGKEIAFLVISVLIVALFGFELIGLVQPIRPTAQEEQSVVEIFKDPYIIITAGSITIEAIALSSIQTTLPLWMYRTMNSDSLQQGLAFTPCDISYFAGSGVFGSLAFKLGRWMCSLSGLASVALVTFLIPFARNIYHLIVPMAVLGLSIGMVEVSMIPHLGTIVDLRHSSLYGVVYSTADLAIALGYLIGPSVSGFVVEHIGFQWLMWTIAICNLLYAPLLIFVRNPPSRTEEQPLVSQTNKKNESDAGASP